MPTINAKKLKKPGAAEHLLSGMSRIFVEHYKMMLSERIKEGIKARKRRLCL